MQAGHKSDKYTMQRGGMMIGNEGDNAFNSIELTRPNGSWFDLTHSLTLTKNMGQLVPTMCEEVYPGEKYKLGQELLVRFVPMLAPAMQRFDARVENFFVPNRILWPAFEQFMKGDAVTLPYMTLTTNETQNGSLADYLGIPHLTGANTLKVQALPFAAVQRIFFDYYRNQNLSAITDADKPILNDGDNTATAELRDIHIRAYQHDYFTSALPFTQKGTEATIDFNFTDVRVVLDDANYVVNETVPSTPVGFVVQTKGSPKVGTFGDDLFAATSDLNGTSFTVNDFRLALAKQHWLERMAVGGTRYTEIIRAHFGVTPEDFRLDRPEYIGGMKTPVVISEVLQTSETSASPQGNMAGHAIGAGFNPDQDYYEVKEHGWIISILSVMPKATYTNGCRRQLLWNLRNLREEWYWPQFANLGEQAIKKAEIFANTVTATQDEDWGYTGRFNELRYIPNRACGQIRNGNLQFWTAARGFSGVPSLSEGFITGVQDDTAKLFYVEPDATNPEMIINILHKVQAYKLMPKYPTPEIQG